MSSLRAYVEECRQRDKLLTDITSLVQAHYEKEAVEDHKKADITSLVQAHYEKKAVEDHKKAKGGDEVLDIAMQSLTGNIFSNPP